MNAQSQPELRRLCAMFEPPCLLPRQKMVMWTMPCMVQPALVKQEFGRADLLLALSPIQHRPAYYLVWVDAQWYEDQTMADHVDDIYEAIGDEFGHWSSWEEDHEGDAYQWPLEDFSQGSCWRKACADDILTARRRKLLQPA